MAMEQLLTSARVDDDIGEFWIVNRICGVQENTPAGTSTFENGKTARQGRAGRGDPEQRMRPRAGEA